MSSPLPFWPSLHCTRSKNNTNTRCWCVHQSYCCCLSPPASACTSCGWCVISTLPVVVCVGRTGEGRVRGARLHCAYLPTTMWNADITCQTHTKLHVSLYGATDLTPACLPAKSIMSPHPCSVGWWTFSPSIFLPSCQSRAGATSSGIKQDAVGWRELCAVTPLASH